MKVMLKRYFMALSCLLGFSGLAQNPGLLISEFYQNPPSSDSPFEYVELLATDDIDFSVTPYTIIVSNNGTATANGWIEGNSLTYAFEINTGSVTVGDVVYVGGVSMAPTGTILRAIDTGVDGGDGAIGNANVSGVFGNGGGNADGIAVFNLPVASITSFSVPTDAVFYGTGIGGAEVSAIDGYELPNNDLYAGGKLNAASFYALDADLTIATGEFDLATNTFTIPRTFASGAATETSEITFYEPTPKLSFVTEEVTVNEDAGTLSFDIEIVDANASASTCDIEIRGSSTATLDADFTLIDETITFPALSTGTLSFEINIDEDLLEEQSEYIIITLNNFVNAELDGTTEMFVYITDNDRVIPTATNELKLDLLTSFSTGSEGSSSAEIVAFDKTSNRLFIANSVANAIDIVDFSDPSSPSLISSFNLDTIGGINSVAVYDGIVAAAIQAPVAQDNGYILFIDNDGNWLNRLEVGVLPDMITFTHAGDKVIAACEGEPSDDYMNDPEGSVSIVHISGAVEDLTAADVTIIDFLDFDGMEASLIAVGVRIFGPGASVSEDLEPEYVTVLPGDEVAYVVLQENNAIAVVDLIAEEITEIIPLGTKDHSLFGNGMDISNQTSGINIANFPVQGFFMPDAISNIQVGGTNYIVTANEGDSRDYDGYSEEERIKDVVLDSLTFLDRGFLQQSLLGGRLKMTTAQGDIDDDGDFDIIYTYGARSFTIWAEDGTLVFDSGDMIEQIIANDPVFVNIFNADNEGGSISQKNRSDDKGPEPEGVYTAEIDGNAFVFVSLERVGGVMAFNINDPYNPSYIGYYNNRDVVTNEPDRGAEGMIYIDAADSPTGNGILILANEVSSTLSVYEVSSCVALSGVSLSTEGDATEFCEGETLDITANSSTTIDYQWMMDGSNISGETTDVYSANMSGNYQLYFSNATEACVGTTDSIYLEMLPAPAPVINVTAAVLSTGTFSTYQWYFEGTAITGATANEYTPTVDGEYSVVVTNAEGCEGEATITVNFTNTINAENSNFSIYPNPSNGLITVHANENGIVSIYSVTGEIILTHTISNNQNLNLDLTEVPTGIYFVELKVNNQIKTQKLIIK